MNIWISSLKTRRSVIVRDVLNLGDKIFLIDEKGQGGRERKVDDIGEINLK